MRSAALLALLPCAALAVDDAALMADRPARLLSEYGLFADLSGQSPASHVVPYNLATPLFSDHTRKLRFVYSPGAAEWSDDEAFGFPVGAALVKTFAYPEGDGLRLIETRILIRQSDGWAAWPYLWLEDQSDARLKLAGARIDLTATGPGGEAIPVSYRVPNANQCKGCHERAGAITPIGPKARNLNHAYPYAGGAANQLDRWRALGLLAPGGAPPASADWRRGDAGHRARAYLDVNCAHCHRRDGPASNSGLFLTLGESDPTAYGVRKRPVSAGRGSGGLEFDIAPGDPARSIMVHRMKSAEPGVAMPELGRALPHDEGVALIEAWIAEME